MATGSSSTPSAGGSGTTHHTNPGTNPFNVTSAYYAQGQNSGTPQGVQPQSISDKPAHVDASKYLNQKLENAHPGGNGVDAPFQMNADSLWSQMMADHEAGLQGQLQGTYADEANAGRRMAEMNAMGGGRMGGAFAGGMAQTAIGGEQARLKARNDHLKQGLEMKMARLQQLIKQAEANRDRNLQRELQAEADKTQMAIAGQYAGSDLPPESG
jgi:hypothetical protein